MASTRCPQCYLGKCKVHVAAAGAVSAKELALQRMYDTMVGSQLAKLRKETSEATLEAKSSKYKDDLDKVREKKRKSSKKSSSKAKDVHSGSGLNPQALAAICSSDSEDEAKRAKKSSKKKAKKSKDSKKKKRKRYDSSGSSDSSDSDDGRAAKKHHKRRD
ncbi:hypothetical protein SPRG_10880 [Saprolegnia parasitica CBS 223.65]|uniref:Uncharacterized protein n=1 Tax=Saprolegnia parasitica (strain CBS 223.65) TaxID=695850 RepID=A0A067C0P2_SAPPC|nr:hypothetical protein SPRG_10880 [Saprolegnia parasitica CBS 223.65]KDO24093.1 hypothetical protein SPRG_10880 [Saprolegnia parasitica CBS 223.65]|eukprot:XP_012205229.1 hypothetical protein SPRG_10880 [Saprolegnia parasitica CBS 223.65]